VVFDFVMEVLAAEFQVLELVALGLVKEGPDLVMKESGLVLVVLDPEEVGPVLVVEVLALAKEDPDFVRDLVLAWADLVATVDLDVATDVLELE